MFESPLRQAATHLLEAAIRIAPAEVRDWGQAMRGELYQIESGWAAIWWALGGAGVLAKHALAALVMPGRYGKGVPGSSLFAKNVSLRKVAFIASGVYVLGALLFFAAPPFRQGLRVSLSAWNSLFHVTGPPGQLKLQGLAKRAEARQDAEGLVFVAVRLWDAKESARLVMEAVRLNPGLLWAYAVVAVRHPALPGIAAWIPRLERMNPQNALFPLIVAESIDLGRLSHASQRRSNQEQTEPEASEGWRNAMAAAFASPKFDDYVDRLKNLDRRVMRRYDFNHPQELLSGDQEGLPTYAYQDARRFAKLLLEPGRTLESGVSRERATAQYWAVARFGQVIDSQAHTFEERHLGTRLQAMAYQRLEKLSQQEGKPGEAALFAYLMNKFNPPFDAGAWRRERDFALDVSRRNAAVMQISSLLMLIFAGPLIVVAGVLITRGRRGKKLGAGATVLGLTSAVGFLLSSATLYLTYRPYWYIFQGAVLKGETSQTGDLHSFLAALHTLPGIKPYPGQLLWLPVYFWMGVILAAMAGLMLILLRHFRRRTRLHQAQPDPHVP